MNDSSATIGKNIRVLRHAAGIKTQAQFAQLLEVSQPQVSDWENDRYAGLEQSTLTKISNVLGCSIDVLLAGTETPAANKGKHVVTVQWHVGDVVAKHRRARKLTRTTLAKQAKLPTATVIAVEEQGSIHIDELEAIGAAFGLDARHLMGDIPADLVLRSCRAPTLRKP